MRTMFYQSNAKTFRFAKKLRAEMTGAEKFLWSHLSNKQIEGYRFKRQHPIMNYIADFYCHKAKLIIEVDGKIHERPDRIAHDNERALVIRELGCRILRFTNEKVMNNIDDVILTIKKELFTTDPAFKGKASPSGEAGGAGHHHTEITDTI